MMRGGPLCAVSRLPRGLLVLAITVQKRFLHSAASLSRLLRAPLQHGDSKRCGFPIQPRLCCTDNMSRSTDVSAVLDECSSRHPLEHLTSLFRHPCQSPYERTRLRVRQNDLAPCRSSGLPRACAQALLEHRGNSRLKARANSSRSSKHGAQVGTVARPKANSIRYAGNENPQTLNPEPPRCSEA